MSVVIISVPDDEDVRTFQGGPARPNIVAVESTRGDAEEKVAELARSDHGQYQYVLFDAERVVVSVGVES